MRRVTMQNIADVLGVTRMTVSKALGGKPGVSRETRERILQGAESMGYARGAPAAEAPRCAVVVPRRFFLECERGYTEIAHYLSQRSLHDGYAVDPVVVGPQEEAQPTLPEEMLGAQYDRIFLLGEMQEGCVRLLAARSEHTVAIHFECRAPGAHSVLVDHYRLGGRAAQYLLDKGHRRIGFVGDVQREEGAVDQYLGFVKAMLRAGQHPRPEWLLCDCGEMRLPPVWPTALICHGDRAVGRALEALRRVGLRVPQDVSLLGLDSSALGAHLDPPLTAFEIHSHDVARIAYEAASESAVRAQSSRVDVPVRLTERASVAQRRGAP